MKNRALFLSVIVPIVLVFPGCANIQGMEGNPQKARSDIQAKYPNLKKCSDPSCSVTVTASACDKASINADPAELAVVEKPMVLVWNVTSPGYTFARNDGIFFKNDPNGYFKCRRSAGSDTQFQCWNTNGQTIPTEFQYGITLVYNGQRCRTDPIIINGYAE
jgi:hypothetical protein